MTFITWNYWFLRWWWTSLTFCSWFWSYCCCLLFSTCTCYYYCCHSNCTLIIIALTIIIVIMTLTIHFAVAIVTTGLGAVIFLFQWSHGLWSRSVYNILVVLWIIINIILLLSSCQTWANCILIVICYCMEYGLWSKTCWILLLELQRELVSVWFVGM